MDKPPLSPAPAAESARPWIAARPAPVPPRQRLLWLRSQFAASPASALVSVLLLALAAWWLPALWSWAVTRAEFSASAQACRVEGVGACWGVVAEKYRLILLGRYPQDQAWRPLLATLLWGAVVGLSLWRRRVLGWAGLLGMAGAGFLLHGGAGLPVVPPERWGGLPLTLLLATCALALAFPLGLALALGRRASLPLLRVLCTTYIELVRSVPLVSVLFMASFLLPLLLPQGGSMPVLLRVVLGLSLFAAAYLAEVLRGGLQALPPGQTQAAAALGLGYWDTQRHIVLPQVLRMVLPGLVNNFIGLFKDTALVTAVSLYELTGALDLALGSDPDWRPYKLEASLFVALIYFVCCFAMSRYSQRLERLGPAGVRHG